MSDEHPAHHANGPILLCAGTEPASARRLAAAASALLAERPVVVLATDMDASATVAGTTERAATHDGALGSEARALAHRARRPPPASVPARRRSRGRRRGPRPFAHDGSATSTALQRAVQA